MGKTARDYCVYRLSFTCTHHINILLPGGVLIVSLIILIPFQNPDELDDVFHSSGPSPSPPSYHKAISNSYLMPPYVMRRSLPVPASVSQIGKDGEDVRRVTPPGSSGSSTTGSCPRHLPAPPTPYAVKGTTQYLTHVRREPPPLSSYHPPTVAQKRTAPDGNRGQWL
ncbi:hypothetical protein BSL78_09765 [Apostichopus japonicus]|uniref:Uncharacterized protein n=1 Tax=Stichopus japonicus TaxID=307972 RepID=A0A2G8KZC5_STIJA|nr:hypothetical protein BSL78_09765 [Apostichopus japonicus]